MARKCSPSWRRFGKLRDHPWSVRLKALLPNWMPWIRKRYRMTPAMEKQLLGISARQMDRRLRAQKSERKRRVYGRTKPGSLLKHHIPVKTDSWDVTSPGFSEIDLVAHCGNSGEGEFAHTLNLTDIHSGWTVVPNHDEQPVVCHATSMRLLDAQIDVAWHAYRAIAATDALLVRTGSLQDLHTGLVLV
jgi:hypothetical protein